MIERTSETDFFYDIPMGKTGNFVIILKFCEVF